MPISERHWPRLTRAISDMSEGTVMRLGHRRCGKSATGKCADQQRLQSWSQNKDVGIRVLHVGQHNELWVVKT